VFKFRKNPRLILLEATTLIVCLILSSQVSIVYPENTDNFTVPCTINTFGNAWEGELAFGLFQTNATNGPTGSYLVVMSTNGTLEYLRYSTDQSYEVVKNIAPDTLMFDGEPVLGGASDAPILATHFWNYVTNTTEDFPGVVSHHDVDYDPINNTFLTLQDYVRNVNGINYLYDKIVELNATGYVLWSWDTYDHIPLSEAEPVETTAVINNQTVVDFTHANAIDWDYNDSIIYLNLRHTNTFYKIDQNTGNIIWACGQFGNFTLLNATGEKVSSLWYHSHATYQVAPDVFIMFDNDYHNETNADDCHSRMIEVTLNEQNMTAWVSWSWEAPTQYWTPYWGKVDRLPNGDRIGVFGTTTHKFSNNQPWNFNDTGAVIVEVNQTGTVVRIYTFPTGWGIYRIDEITNQSQSSPSPTISPTPESTPTPSSQPSATPSSPSNLQIVAYVTIAAIGIVMIAAALLTYLKKKKPHKN
jgi:hypothetical protein